MLIIQRHFDLNLKLSFNSSVMPDSLPVYYLP
jgi:hypothetical protein